MAKKHKANQHQKTESTFDFSTLLTYCSEEEKEKFRQGLKEKSVSSLLWNSRHFSLNALLDSFPSLRRDSFDELCFYFDKDEDRLGKSLEHFAGGFYIMDHSSMVISKYIAPLLKKDFLSMDLCAAPGGKSIALDMRREDGLYLCNDISFERANEIVKNATRLHLDNILTLSLDPMRLELEEIFDLVILDAPCSGSGMLRKEKKMALDFSLEKVERLLPIQENLLEKAYELACKDGYIVYSTCAFSTQEDEEQIQKFLTKHSDIEILPIDKEEKMIEGVNHLGYHLIPGIYEGEGIYFILMKKTGGSKTNVEEAKYKKASLVENKKVITYKNKDYIVPRFYDAFSSLPFLSPGIKIYDDSPYPKCDFDHGYCKVATSLPLLSLSRSDALSYACGNEIKVEGKDDGLYIVSYEGLRLGFGKKVSNKLKNYLPKGLKGYYC